MNFKSLLLSVVIFMVFICTIRGQVNLSTADSLFAEQKYTEAISLYEDLFQQDQASLSMLLKMAYIKEGLGDYVNALYFLNLYYEESGNKKVLDKVQELADKHELTGYGFSDIDFFLNILNKYQVHFLLGLVALSLAFFFYLVFKIRRSEPIGVIIFFQALTFALIFLVINDVFLYEKGIVQQDNTLLMTAPSAAAIPLQVIEKGHRVRVLEEQAVWLKIQWEDQEAYMRKARIRLI